MEARTLSINGVIQNNTLLRIPYFQRRYVWKEDDWLRFANDMESTLDSERYYFLGAIIFKEEEVTMADKKIGIGKKYLVVDGQQRLTTLSIYMKVLYMMVAKTEDFKNQYLQDTDVKGPVIIHSCDDMPHFKNVMHLDVLKELSGDSSIIKAYNFFRNYLDKRRNEGVNMNELLNTVKAGVTFVVITLNREDDEQQIFDTINSLGVPLTTAELVKNFLYEANDENAYSKTWKKVFDTDEAREFWESDSSKSRQSKSKDNTTIERFFHAFVRIKMWDFKDELTEAQRKSFVKIENVFVTCKAFVECFGMNKQDLANEIIEYAKLFREHLNENILDIRVPQHAGIKRISCLINATKNYSVIPYVLYLLRDVKNEKERNLIFGYLETYLIRRIMTRSSNNNYSDLFSENLISQRINNYADFKEYIDGKSDDKALAMPKEIKVKSGLNNNKMDEISARIIFYLYETKLSKTSEQSFTGGFNNYVAELFMPKPGKDSDINWPKHDDPLDEENRKQIISTLGNYFLLSVDNDKELKKIHNEPFPKKIKAMKKLSDNIRCCQILDNCKNWSETEIINRNNSLSTGFCNKIWFTE